MDAKLTLKLNAEVISRAKNYARNSNKSLSRMVESYLDAISREEESSFEITPLVKSLIGVINLPPDFDYRKEREERLHKKHS